MIITKSMSDGWLSNSWLVGDRPGGKAVLIDTGGPVEPLLERIEAERLELTHLLYTHHHVDHVEHHALYKQRFGCPAYGNPLEREHFRSFKVELDGEIGDGDELVTGDLQIRALHTPGHSLGMLAFVVNEAHVFTGDTLFHGTIGGTRAPGHTTFEDIRHSIMDVLMALPKSMTVHPGHTDPTTIGQEWEHNPFIRIWRELDPIHEARCTAFGEPATLILRAPDYDGGTKCWVRFDDGDKHDIVPGSKVVVES